MALKPLGLPLQASDASARVQTGLDPAPMETALGPGEPRAQKVVLMQTDHLKSDHQS